ncbi:MAG: radical SAM family heme chaperone HemW [candidate division WOR-3 bacterium]
MSQNQERGLYIHIPFCQSRCPYCSFYSETGLHLSDDFLEALANEAQEFKGYCFSTCYIGGGTPSVLSPDQTERLFGIIRENFELDRGAEITVEVNPESATGDLLRTLKGLGANRLSVGAQSTWDSELERLGRRHRNSDTIRCVENALAVGFSNINLDLIFGFIGQTEESWRKSLVRATELPITHISTYALSPHGGVEELSEEKIIAMYEIRDEVLGARGFLRYEISNYARPGYESMHNLIYWRRKEYLGLGPSASSFMGNRRWRNEPDLELYLKAPPFQREEETLTPEQVRLEEIFLGLRLSEGIDLGISELPEELVGLVEIKNRRVSLTPKGVLVSDRVALELFEVLGNQ